jgi:hypothetical protein
VGKETIFPYKVLAEARRLASLMLICFPTSSAVQDNIRWVSWHPSREECFVLNVDRSCLGPWGFGACWCRRVNSKRGWLLGDWVQLLPSDCEHGCTVYGLNLASYHGCTVCCCYSDSKTAIDLITKHVSVNRFHSYASVIANIKELMNLEWEVNLSHTLREGNSCADFLAKVGSSNDTKLSIWSSPPEGLNS